MKTYKKIKDLSGFTGSAALFELSEPLDGYKFVVASAANAMFSGPETYLFGANKNGVVQDWGELAGSSRGIYDHEAALSNAGYSPTP